jgi:hypothetical protein
MSNVRKRGMTETDLWNRHLIDPAEIPLAEPGGQSRSIEGRICRRRGAP